MADDYWGIRLQSLYREIKAWQSTGDGATRLADWRVDTADVRVTDGPVEEEEDRVDGEAHGTNDATPHKADKGEWRRSNHFNLQCDALQFYIATPLNRTRNGRVVLLVNTSC